jgi:2-C-methyl-D-erythritol 4-phosphate cytidylyltransferase
MAAIVVAAGSGERLGGEAPKALVTVAGRRLVRLAHDAMVAAGAVDVVVVAPPHHDEEVVAELRGSTATTRVVVGGATRPESVRAGLAALRAGASAAGVVAVHDAARALTPVATIRAAVAAVAGEVVAAAPALPLADTVKRVADGVVVATLDRGELVAVQTPQVFRRDVLERAHAGRGEATDDLALVEALVADGMVDGRVVVTPGSPLGLKITFPHDLVVAEALALAFAESGR